MKTAFVASVLLLIPANLSAQLTAENLVAVGRQGVDLAANMGEPKERCAINAFVGDNGYVVQAFGNNGLAAGDTIKSVNRHNTDGMATHDIGKLLEAISPSSSVNLQIVRNGVSSFRTIQCVDARPFIAPLIAAYAAAARKDFKACLDSIRTAPADLQSDWRFMFIGTQCAVQLHAIDPTDEPGRVQGWISALLEHARYSRELRATAADAVHRSEAYFREKGRMDLWSSLNASLASLPGVVTQAESTGTAPSGQDADGDGIIPCDHVPSTAVRIVPPPLDRYVTLVCTNAGQALKPLNGDTWVFDQGAMWLGAANPKGPSITDHYTQLSYSPLSADETAALRAELRKLRPKPSVLTRTILRFSVATSWGGRKEIYLLPAPLGASPEAHTLGMECIHGCRPIEKDPWFFSIIPKA